MKKENINKQTINIISQCYNDFDKNLKDKKIMFIFEEKDKHLDKIETIFPSSCFYHLTGIKGYDINNKPLNSYNFYDLIGRGRIDEMKLSYKNSTTFYKLEVLPQLMRIDKNAQMIGEFNGNNLYLQTDKIIGNINACLGFAKDNELYIPNTSLKEDIRNITENRFKIVAILKKNINENLYTDITYLKNNYNIQDILTNKDITKNIDVENMFSGDRTIDEKLVDFYYNNKSTDTEEDDEEDEWER